MEREEGQSVESMTQLVRAKERELHEMHEMRCSQLEKMIEERDNLLQEANRRFNLLREDFQYNLSLLEARDNEICRLKQVEIKLEATSSEKETLAKRVESLLLKDCERNEKSQQEKAQHKKMLLELQNEVESLRWSTGDELKTKMRETEQVRQELCRVQAERDEALEHQRNELTSLYENMLQDRENEFARQEQSICSQVHQLEKKFQKITSDNTRLKSDSAKVQRTCEKLTVELSTKDERCNQLSWQVEDYAKKLQDTEETLYSKIQTLESENHSQRESIEQLSHDHKRELDKMKSEMRREKDFAALKMKQWEEHSNKAYSDVDKLTISLDESKEREALLTKELEHSRDKTRNFGIKEMELKSQISEQKNQLTAKENLIEELQNKLQETKQKLNQLEDNYEYLEQSTNERISRAGKEAKEMESEMAVMRANLQAEYIVTQEENEKKYIKEIDTLKTQLEDRQQRIAALEREVESVTKQLDDERAESDAMRLRLTLHAADVKHHKPLPAPGTNDSIPRLPQYLQDLASPRFSEDFGPVSIPTSPMSFRSPYYMGDSSRQGPYSRGKTKNSPRKSKDDLELLSLSGSNLAESSSAFPTAADKTSGEGDRGSDNKRLKIIIKEMRQDAETLYAEMQKAVAEKEKADEQVKTLEERLLQASMEVNRLREERRKLMDVNNELRASLRKLEHTKVAENKTVDEMPAKENTAKQNSADNAEDKDIRLYVRGYSNDPPSKIKASDRQTKSQQEALQRLKDKAPSYSFRTNKRNIESQQTLPQRKVVNYANMHDFE